MTYGLFFLSRVAILMFLLVDFISLVYTIRAINCTKYNKLKYSEIASQQYFLCWSLIARGFIGTETSVHLIRICLHVIYIPVWRETDKQLRCIEATIKQCLLCNVNDTDYYLHRDVDISVIEMNFTSIRVMYSPFVLIASHANAPTN